MKIPFHRLAKEGQKEVQRWTWRRSALLWNIEGGKK
jgi:hypothetical protein